MLGKTSKLQVYEGFWMDALMPDLRGCEHILPHLHKAVSTEKPIMITYIIGGAGELIFDYIYIFVVAGELILSTITYIYVGAEELILNYICTITYILVACVTCDPCQVGVIQPPPPSPPPHPTPTPTHPPPMEGGGKRRGLHNVIT